MARVYLMSELRMEDGRTLREHNMDVAHKTPLGTLVEVKYDEWHGGGACSRVHARLWVVSQDRDCDGTPLYTLAEQNWPLSELRGRYKLKSGFAESDLTPVEITPRIAAGYDLLAWPDGE